MPENAKPASFVNIAFDSGVIMERTRIIKLLEEHDWSYLEVEASEIISVIKGEK